MANKFLTAVNVLQHKVEAMSTELSAVSSRVTQIEEGQFPNKMIEAVKLIHEEARPSRDEEKYVDEKTIEKMIENSTKDNIAEAQDRARRGRNLLIFGVNEPVQEEREARLEDDRNKATEILSEFGTSEPFKEIRRLGTYSQGKCRPIRLAYASEADRDATIQAFRKSRKGHEGSKGAPSSIQKISMRRDMTPTERKEEAVLFAELKKKTQSSWGTTKHCGSGEQGP